MEEGRSAFKILTGKPTRKGPLGRPRHRWEDNIRMDFKEIVNIPISSLLCYVTMETIWKNTGDGITILRWILKK